MTANLIPLGSRIQFTSAVNGQTFVGIVCGYLVDDTYEVAHRGHIYRMSSDEFTVAHGPCDEEIAAQKTPAPVTPPSVCAFCKQQPADPRSEQGWCMKCHFDLTDDILDDGG